MAFDAPRKTLDEIRREIDAEYGYRAVTDAPTDVAERLFSADANAGAGHVALLSAPPEPLSAVQPRARRVGYVVAGVVGCLAGQIVLLGYQSMIRDSASPGIASISMSASRAASTISSPSPTREAVPPAMTPSPPVPPARVSKPTAVSTPRSATSTPSSRSPTRVVERDAWEKSEEEVRAALSAWLALSRGAEAHAPVSETAVIFGADGRTARTHVPMRSGGGIIVHEQRWRREGNGWSLLDDRQAWASR